MPAASKSIAQKGFLTGFRVQGYLARAPQSMLQQEFKLSGCWDLGSFWSLKLRFDVVGI